MISTFGIFYLMQSLVASDVVELSADPERSWTEWVQTETSPPPPRKIDRLERPEPPKPIPDPPNRPKPPNPTRPTIGVGPPTAPPTTVPDDGLPGWGLSDGDKMILVRVAPTYPTRAITQGKEGWVLIEFNVSEMGTVEDAVVVDAEPKGYFERAALKAIAKFKYKPTIVDGQPRASEGVRFRMAFEIEGDS